MKLELFPDEGDNELFSDEGSSRREGKPHLDRDPDSGEPFVIMPGFTTCADFPMPVDEFLERNDGNCDGQNPPLYDEFYIPVQHGLFNDDELPFF